ncbi:hypothetical protein Tco_1238945 [Tanacetum coccineum]
MSDDFGGRRMMTLEEEEDVNWNEIRCTNIDVCKKFLKLCIIKDPIWERISHKPEEPSRDIHVDECVCCQVQHMTEESSLQRIARDTYAGLK